MPSAALLQSMMDARASITRLPYINHGRYKLLAERFVVIESPRNGTSVVTEFYVLEGHAAADGQAQLGDDGVTPKPHNATGSRCALVCKVDAQGTPGEMSRSNLKAFFEALLGPGVYEQLMANPALGATPIERYGQFLDWLPNNIKGLRVDNETVLQQVLSGKRANKIDARNNWHHVETSPELKAAYCKFLEGTLATSPDDPSLAPF